MNHLVRWQDLTRAQRGWLREMRKSGFLFTPEQAVKMTGQIYFRPRAKPANALHVVVEDEHGRLTTLAEARNAVVDVGGRKKANEDFATVWEQKNMSASINTKIGFVSLSAHGGIHWLAQPLKSYDVDDLLSLMVAAHYAKEGRLPQRMEFTKRIRERIQRLYATLAIAKANQAQMGTQWVPRESTGRKQRAPI